METTKTVRELALGVPGATRVFEKLKIDYCCGGKSLGFACRQQGLDAEAVLAKLLGRLDASRQDDCRK